MRAPSVSLPDQLPDDSRLDALDVYAFRAYATITRRRATDEPVACMAERCQMSVRRMRLVLRDLERRGLIERVERAGSSSVYRQSKRHEAPS